MPTRKNFPGRLEARRLRAAERNAPQARLLPQNNYSSSHVQTESQQDILDRSDPTTKTTETAPVPPTLEEFGLSDGDLKCLPKLWFRSSFTTGSREVYTYLLSDIIIFFLLFHKGIHLSFEYIMGFLGFSFIFLIPFAIFWTTLGFFERQLYSNLNDQFSRYYKYQRAFSAFERHKHEYDIRVAKQRVEYWRSLSGVAFERELGRLFSVMGYTVTYTPATADGGVDLFLKKDGKLTVVQCKAHNKLVPISVARELSASMMDFNADDAIIACFDGVTKPVAEYIKSKRITVLTLREIVAHQTAHG